MYDSPSPHPSECYRLPQPPPPAPGPGGFLLYPLAWLGGMSGDQLKACQWIYQRAFEQAQAVVRPSLLERDLLAVWN